MEITKLTGQQLKIAILHWKIIPLKGNLHYNCSPTYMAITETPKKASSKLSNNWQKQTNVITHNDVLDAYLKGKEAGKTEQQRVNQSLFDNNLAKAQTVSEKLFDEIKKTGIKIDSIHLKADAITSFSALFVSDKNDFLKEEFRNVFIIARNIKNESEDQTFSISFTFTPHSNTLDENCLASDGFFAKYYGKK